MNNLLELNTNIDPDNLIIDEARQKFEFLNFKKNEYLEVWSIFENIPQLFAIFRDFPHAEEYIISSKHKDVFIVSMRDGRIHKKWKNGIIVWSLHENFMSYYQQ